MGKFNKKVNKVEVDSKNSKKIALKPFKAKKKTVENIFLNSLKSKKKSEKFVAIDSLDSNLIKKDVSKIIQKNTKTSIKSVNSSNFEEKFGIKIIDVEQAIKGVIKLHKENPKIKNQLFDHDPFSISLMINCHKVPTDHQKILRIPLTHSLLRPDDDVCLIVSEVKGIGNKEHEKHLEHYENLLKTKGVNNIKKIMTIHEFSTEYETFEQKSRLADLYDYFLVCSKVSGKVVHKCGKIFYKKRKVPTPVKLVCSKLKEHIDKQLSKTYLHIHIKGDSYFVNFGISTMEVDQIVENFKDVVEYLSKEFPGGFDNVKGLHVTATRASSIPIYISTKKSNEIPNPKVFPLKKNKIKPVKGELTTQLEAEVLVKPSGKVRVLKPKKEKRTVSERNEEKDTMETQILPKKAKLQKPSKKEKKHNKKDLLQESKVLENEEIKKEDIKEKRHKLNKNNALSSNKKKDKGKILKIKHMNNSITIENLSSAEVPSKNTTKTKKKSIKNK